MKTCGFCGKKIIIQTHNNKTLLLDGETNYIMCRECSKMLALLKQNSERAWKYFYLDVHEIADTALKKYLLKNNSEPIEIAQKRKQQEQQCTENESINSVKTTFSDSLGEVRVENHIKIIFAQITSVNSLTLNYSIQAAINKLKNECVKEGGNAITAIKLDYITQSDKITIIASGNAIVIKEK